MPNAINPNDYNVEFFNTVFQGTTTVENFRDYLFSRNLPNLPPELVNSPAGNFEPFYNEKGLEKDINYTPITNPGDLDEWFLNGGVSEDADDVRYQMMNPQEKEGKKGSKYGPASFLSYNCPNLEPTFDTGFIQYPTSAGGGDFKDLLKTTLLDGQLNLGPGAAVDFKSDLAELGKERRKQEVINRLKLEGENLLGKVNLDPLGLLSGQDLILKDFDITARPTKGGKILEFATDLVGFEIPGSPIPAGAFGSYNADPNSGNDAESYKDIMASTGSATRSLIFKSIARNAYGPILEEKPPEGGGGLFGRIGNALSSGQAPQLRAYTDPNINQPVTTNKDGESTDELKKPLVDKINQAFGNAMDILVSSKGVGEEEDGPSTVFQVNDSGVYKGAVNEEDPIVGNSQLGFDKLLPIRGIVTDGWADGSPLAYVDPLGFIGELGPIGTGMPIDMDSANATGAAPLNPQPLDGGMFWGKTPAGSKNPFKRGILKFTQDLINNSDGNNSKARYIGAANSADNFVTKNGPGKGKHQKVSMGNTVANNQRLFAPPGEEKEDGYYCRSWSVRNPYMKVKDLIRHGNSDGGGGRTSLTRPDFNLSVLDDNGFVKVAPYISDRSNKGQGDGISLEVGDPTVKKYMLSIENLAWQNSEELLKTPACEHGPNGGRIMWFPPYDINFTDNSSVNWESTNFIGRGEPIYTYNNTERTGTLSFKIVVDHSMALTNIKNEGDDALLQYFAGCNDPVEAARYIIPYTETEQIIIEEQTEEVLIPLQEIPNPPSPPENAIFYFRHAYKFENSTLR